jgi:translation initiation factor IF-2
MTLAEARTQEDPPTEPTDEATAPVEPVEAEEEYEEYEPEVTDTRMGKGFGVIAAAALIVALASAVTAGATVFYILESTTRSEERTAQLVAALKEPQSYALQGSAGATNQSGAVQGAQPGQPGAAAAQPGQPGAQAQAGGAQPGAASAGGATQGQQGAQPQAQPGAASAGGAAQGQAAPAAPQAAAPGQQAAPQQAAPAAPAPAASAPMPSADLLLQTTMAAAQPGVPGAELAKRTVDGPVTAGTLEQVAGVRSRMAPPPGMEAMGDIVKFDVRDVVVTGDTATATMTIIWPAGWGEWTYPNSGFQYVDGEWKLQKSTVCNLASAAWVNCY